jgi:hypothetical protein
MSKNSSEFVKTQLELAALVKGLEGLPQGETVLVSGVSRGRDDLVQTGETHLVRYTSTEEAHMVARQKAKDRNDMHPQARAFVKDMKAALKTKYGARSTTLLDFGITPEHEKRALTPDEKKAAADKMRQTRQRNHTMGRRQKRALAEQQPPAPPAAPKS